MLGRKSYTQEELDHCGAAIDQQLGADKALIEAVAGATTDEKVSAALEDFEVLFFNNLNIVLDRYFVHRLRVVTGKDGNPLNEVEMLCDSLLNNDGVLRDSKVIKLIPEQSVVKLQIGDRRAGAQVPVGGKGRPPAAGVRRAVGSGAGGAGGQPSQYFLATE